MAESKIVDEIIDDIVARGVEEVNGQSCVWRVDSSYLSHPQGPCSCQVRGFCDSREYRISSMCSGRGIEPLQVSETYSSTFEESVVKNLSLFDSWGI